MADDDLSPEEAAEAEADRTRATAQDTAADLARMGIDPRALGLQPEGAARVGDTPPGAAAAPVGAGHPANVVPLRAQPPVTSPPSQPPGASPAAAAWAVGSPAGAEALGPAAAPLPVELLIGHDPGSAPPRPSVAYLVRAVTFGMLTPDASDAAAREREMVNRVRVRQSDQRVVAFLAGKGGVGTTSVAVGVANVLAALRDDSTVLVSLRSGAPSLGWALSGSTAPTARDVARGDGDVTPLRLGNGLQVVDGPRWAAPVRRQDVPVILDRLGELSTFALVDVGNDTSESGHSIVGRADQIVIVCGAGVDGVDGARLAAERVADMDPYLLDSAIYVVVCQREAALRGVVRAMRELMPGGARVVAVPPEPMLADGEMFDPARVSLETRLAMIDVAGMVSVGAFGSGRGR